MKQREVQDRNNVAWVCVQSMTGGSSAVAEAAAERLESADGTVPVVCTPSGGAASVHVQLPRDWEDSISDAQLLEAIAAAQQA